MPSQTAHLNQARANEDLARELSARETSPTHISWAAVVLFYTALHLVDAYLAQRGTNPATHAERDTLL